MPNPFTETAEQLSARVKAEPGLWDRLSLDQKIALGYEQREQDRKKNANQQKGN